MTDHEERQKRHREEMAEQSKAEFRRRAEVRWKRMEEATAHAVEKVSRSPEETAELQERLRRLESGETAPRRDPSVADYVEQWKDVAPDLEPREGDDERGPGGDAA